MEPEVGAGHRDRSSDDPCLFIEDFLAKIINSDYCKTAEKYTYDNKRVVRIMDKEIEKPCQHHIKEITGRMRLVNGNIIILKCECILNRIHVIEVLACERHSRNDSNYEE